MGNQDKDKLLMDNQTNKDNQDKLHMDKLDSYQIKVKDNNHHMVNQDNNLLHMGNNLRASRQDNNNPMDKDNNKMFKINHPILDNKVYSAFISN